MKPPQQNSETDVTNKLDEGISRITVSGPFSIVLDDLLLWASLHELKQNDKI